MHLSPRQLAAMNSAALEESIIEQIAKLELLVRGLRKTEQPDFKPIMHGLARLEKSLAPKPVDMTPVLRQLSDIRDAIKPAPTVDLAPIKSQLAKMEKSAAVVKPQSNYEFDIVRDDKGKITKVTAKATPKMIAGN